VHARRLIPGHVGELQQRRPLPQPSRRTLQLTRRFGVRHNRKSAGLAAREPSRTQVGATMMQSRPHASAQGGFTLVETMIAIVILTVGILSLLAVFGTAVATTQNAQENLIARRSEERRVG